MVKPGGTILESEVRAAVGAEGTTPLTVPYSILTLFGFWRTREAPLL